MRDRFEALLAEHRKIVFKVASIYCWHAEDRRDLAQEIQAQLWSSFPRYDRRRPFATWAYRIALNVAISWVRSASRRRHEPLEVDLVDAAAVPPDDRLRAVHLAIGRLDPLNRALLLLHLEEHSHREIAEVLGITESNVATKISRLKQRIRKESEEIDGPGSAEGPLA